MGLLDGVMSDPSQMGLMGMAQGLLAASGPSRLPVSMGQAMGQGLQGAQQGYVGGLGLQKQLLQMRAMQGLLGGGQQPAQQQPMTTPGVPVSMGGGLMGGSMPTASPDGATSSGGLFSTPGPNQAQPSQGTGIYGRSPQDLFQQGMLMNMAGIQGGGDLMRIAVEHDPTLAAQMPTDITKMGTQAGMSPADIQAANAAGIKKSNFIAPVALRTPIYFDPNTGTTQVVPSDQLQQGYGAQYGAESRAKAGYQLTQVWDPNANGGRGGMVNQTVSNAADAANGATGGSGTPTLTGIFAQQESSGGRTAPNNPLQIQQGTFKQYAQNGESWDNPADRTAVAQRVLAGYSQKYGGDLGRIATAYFSGEGNVAPAGSPMPFIKNTSDANGKTVSSYVGDILGRAGGSGFGGTGAPRQSGPMASAPPVGYTPATDSAQTAASKQMADAYKGLSDSDSNYQQSRNALTDMLTLSNRQGALDKASSLLPYDWSTKVNSDAAQYAKAHSTFIAQQGNALGAGGTDQSRGTIEESVPTYDKPQSARTAGLNMQLNNLDYRHLKTQIMTPSFQNGDQKGFTNLSAQFDNTVKPEMMPTIVPIMQMSGQQQQSAVKAAIDKNPAMRPAFEMMFNAGMLK